MGRCPKQITPENFPQAWTWLTRKYRKAKHCAMIERICAYTGNLLFLLLMLFFGCGILVQLEIPVISRFVLDLPGVGALWTKYSVCLLEILPFKNAWIWATLLLCWLIPMVVCALPALLVILCYDPVLPHMPEGDLCAQAKALKQLYKDTRIAAKRVTAGAANFCNIAFLVCLAAIVSVSILQAYVQGDPGIELLLGSPYFGISSMVAPFGILFVYSLLNYLLQKVLGLFHICRFSKAAVEAIESYYALWSPPKIQQYQPWEVNCYEAQQN